MRSRYYVREEQAAHFITSTIVQWLPVFTTAACCDILVESLAFCRSEKGLRLYAWVIMENHFHAVAAVPELSRTIADLKKFTARRILEQLPVEGRDWLRADFEYFRARHKINSRHEVWQEGSHPQAIMNDAVMRQKLDYVHHNPVRAGRVASPEHWRYSSAHECLPGASPVMKCDEWLCRGAGAEGARRANGVCADHCVRPNGVWARGGNFELPKRHISGLQSHRFKKVAVSEAGLTHYLLNSYENKIHSSHISRYNAFGAWTGA